MKLYKHQRLIVIYMYFKFHEIRFRGYLGYLVIAKYTVYGWILNKFKGYNSWVTKASLAKLDMHQRLIVIYIWFKFHEIQFRGYLVIAKYMDFKSTQGLCLSVMKLISGVTLIYLII